MGKVYDFKKLRDATRDIKGSKEVLNQLLSIAFNNDTEPDTLPSVFYLNNIPLNASELEQLFDIYHIDVELDMITRDWFSRIANFKVTLKT